MKKIHNQLLVIVGLIMFFVCLNMGIYNLFTKRCISDYSDGLKAKSIELDRYLPFVEDSEVVKVDSELMLEGDLPILDGAAALYPIFSATVHAIYPQDCVHFDGENFTEESALQYRNTRGAYKAIVDGDVDIAICVKPSEEQLNYAKEQGVELELVPIGKEAFVFIVNKNNPVDDLSEDEIRDIYAGEITNWSKVGGDKKLISPIQRNQGSGSQTAMISFMNGREMPRDYNSFLGSAIGFSFRFYVEGIVEDGGVKMLSVNGVYPNVENIKNDSYPVVQNIYAVYRKDNTNENIPIVIDWLLSDEGQQMIEDTGYVGVNVIE